MNMTRERCKDKWWDCEYEDPTYDGQEDTIQPKKKTPKTKLQQMELELEYDIDEI